MVHDVVDVFVRENVSSMVPAAPSNPYKAMCSCDGWQLVVAVVVLVGAGAVVVGATVVVVAADAEELDVVGLEGLLEHAQSAEPVARAANSTATARVAIRMFLLLLPRLNSRMRRAAGEHPESKVPICGLVPW
jgi:hypothetical protein